MLTELETHGMTDMARTRVLEDGAGMKIHIRASDPYGFWKVRWPSDNTPKELKGEYTSYSDAKLAVESYLRRNSRVIKSEKKTIEELKNDG